MRWRIWFTGLSILALIVFCAVYGAFQGPIEGPAATAQMSNDPVVYSAGRAVAGGFILSVVKWATTAAVALVWLTMIFRSRKNKEVQS